MQKMAEKYDVIMDGRDIGTVVLKNAKYKFFLTATPEERATRRYDELLEVYKGYNIHRYNRGEWERIGAEIKDDDLIVEADTIEEVRKWLDENI